MSATAPVPEPMPGSQPGSLPGSLPAPVPVPVALPPVEEADFRRAVGHFGSGVTVVTTRVGTFDHAMTASAFSSVSLEPPMVLVCVDKEARFRDAVVESGFWAVSILSTDGRRAADWFALKGRPLVGQLDRYPHHREVTGAALLDGSLAFLECATKAVYDGGDHDIVLGTVVSAVEGARDADPLLYRRSRYGRSS